MKKAKTQHPKRPRKPKVTFKEIFDRLAEQAWQERLAWLKRPKIHTAAFEDPKPGTVEPAMIAADRDRKCKEVAKILGSDERLGSFKALATAYRKEPSVQNYLRIRREFPELEIQVAYFGGMDPLFTLAKEFTDQGIDPHLVAGALDANEPSIDALCLRLLELLAARDNLPKNGPGYIEKRRSAISDATINYLIVVMFEAMDWCGELLRIPASLVVLARQQLSGLNPDLHQHCVEKDRRHNAAFAAGQIFQQTNERISVRKLAARFGVSRSTAARWLADKQFQRDLEAGRKFVANEGFARFKAAHTPFKTKL